MPKPLVFITGFLGAGKTTLLRALLKELHTLGRSADVILNDFENAEIDASTLPDYAASVSPIAASCACCDSMEDLVKLCLAAKDSMGDVLLIELNGTADPLPLLETFTLLEEKLPFFPRLQVGVVDARRWGGRGDVAALEVRQIETATHWMPSHTANLSKTDRSALTKSIATINRHAREVDAAQLAAEIATSRHEHHETTIIANCTSRCASASDHDHDHDHDHIHDHAHQLSHRFTGIQIALPGQFRRKQMTRFLNALPDDVVRAKALVKLREAPGSRWLFERVGRHPVEAPIPIDELNRISTSLVCIGPDLQPEQLHRLVAAHFGL